MREVMDACEVADIPLYGTDFLCRALAILYCYGGGPGGEFFRAPVGYAVSIKGEQMMDTAVREKDWETIKKFRHYVTELQADDASWLERTLERLNIPPQAISYKECLK